MSFFNHPFALPFCLGLEDKRIWSLLDGGRF